MLQLLEKLLTNPRVLAILGVAIAQYFKNKNNIIMADIQETPREAGELLGETKAPLGLPPGTIRALIALVLLGATITDYALGNFTLPDEFHALTIAAVGYYIGVRSEAFMRK